LTSGRPVSPLRDVPLLVDETGAFRWRFLALLRAAAIQSRADLLEQIDIELEAQLARLARDGVRADHIDGERHVHLIPGIFERVAAAAKRHDILFVRLGKEIGNQFLGLGDAAGLLMSGGFLKFGLLSALSRRNRKRLHDVDQGGEGPVGQRGASRGGSGGVVGDTRGGPGSEGGGGVRSADYFASYLYSGRLDLVLRSILDRPPKEGVTEIMVHPGIPEESRGLVLGNHELERYLASEDRRKELEACIEARRWLSGDSGGWRLTTFGGLAREAVVPG
jgi:hypothetical protein